MVQAESYSRKNTPERKNETPKSSKSIPVKTKQTALPFLPRSKSAAGSKAELAAPDAIDLTGDDPLIIQDGLISIDQDNDELDTPGPVSPQVSEDEYEDSTPDALEFAIV